MSSIRTSLAFLIPLCLAATACAEDSDSASASGTYPHLCFSIEDDSTLVVSHNEDISELAAQGGIPSCLPGTLLLNGSSPGNLTSLSGLETVEFIGQLELRGNFDIANLQGMTSLKQIQRLELFENRSVVNLEGLESLQTVGELDIFKEELFVDFSGLEVIRTLDALDVRANDSLESFHGLEELTTIRGDTTLADNVLITEFVGLEKLDTIEGDLVIELHPDLESLSGLNGITFIGGDLSVKDNPKLSTCAIEAWADNIEIGGAIILHDNFPDENDC